MTKQFEALLIAAQLESWAMPGSFPSQAVAELRRLHEVNEDLLKTMRQLACLDNVDHYGKSACNIIAQVALNKATGETE